jgi:hypothetical protein
VAGADQDVHVAAFGVLTARHRPEHPHIVKNCPCRLSFKPSDEIQRHLVNAQPLVAEQDLVGWRQALDIQGAFGSYWVMRNVLEEITRRAVHLSRQQRLALARFLIEMDDPGDEGTAAAWDLEIRERVRAVEDGRAVGIPYDEVLARIDRRLAP